MKILMNHIGYACRGAKHAVVMGSDGEDARAFRIIESSTGSVMHSGAAAEAGEVGGWKGRRFWTVDFDSLQKEGSYYIECDTSSGKLRSCEFTVEENLLGKQPLSDAIFYFKAQRCSGDFDRADRHVPFDGERKGCQDLHGGWYDASGDYGKHLSHLSHSTYFNPQQGSFAVWALFKVFELLEASGNTHYGQIKRRIMDEAMYGADYMYRMRAPSGTFFRSVQRRGKYTKAEDRRIAFQLRRSSSQFGAAATAAEETVTDESYETGFRQGAGFAIAALAAASRYSYPGDYTREQYLQAAKDAYAYLDGNNHRYLNDGRANIIDDFCSLAALTELYRASLEPEYLQKAGEKADMLIRRLFSSGQWKHYWRADDEGRPFFHPSDAGLPVVALLNYLEIEKDADIRARVLDAVKKAMEFELQVTGEVNNPFGLARQLVQSKDGSRRTAFFMPHDTEASPWWQGENARLASLAAAARLTARYAPENAAELTAYADNQINWILGMNPFDSCMLQGSGRNNPQYYFTNGFDYTNCPGGICNGITGGLADEKDVELFSRSRPGVVDDNWRWAEQWLPHASWYIYATALGI